MICSIGKSYGVKGKHFRFNEQLFFVKHIYTNLFFTRIVSIALQLLFSKVILHTKIVSLIFNVGSGSVKCPDVLVQSL